MADLLFQWSGYQPEFRVDHRMGAGTSQYIQVKTAQVFLHHGQFLLPYQFHPGV
jgi:hypothetical protein